MFSKLKKGLVGLALGLGLFTGCADYPSVPLKGNYPELTAERKADLEERVLADKDKIIIRDGEACPADKECVHFSEEPRELFNYFYEFWNKEFERKNLREIDLEGIDLSIITRKELNDQCSKKANGCYDNKTVYLTNQQSFDVFFTNLNHEVGHDFRGNKEFTSTSREVLSALKIYQFSRKIGSSIVKNAFPIQDYMKKEFSAINPWELMYARGFLYALVNWKNNNFDIEKALDSMTDKRYLEIVGELDTALEKIPGRTPKEKEYFIWNQILDGNKLRNKFAREMSFQDADEFVAYLRFMNEFWYGPASQDQQVFEDLLSYDRNPFFRAEAVFNYVEFFVKEYIDLFAAKKISGDEAFAFYGRAIDLMEDYPCDDDNYRCPQFIREATTAQIGIYYFASVAAEKTKNTAIKDRFLQDAVNFLYKYYGEVFDLEDPESIGGMDKMMNNAVPSIIRNATNNLEWADKPAAERKMDLDLAKKLLAAAAHIRCNDYGSTFPKDVCLNYQEKCLERLEYIRTLY